MFINIHQVPYPNSCCVLVLMVLVRQRVWWRGPVAARVEGLGWSVPVTGIQPIAVTDPPLDKLD